MSLCLSKGTLSRNSSKARGYIELLGNENSKSKPEPSTEISIEHRKNLQQFHSEGGSPILSASECF